jgi:hypothetical protein
MNRTQLEHLIRARLDETDVVAALRHAAEVRISRAFAGE